MDKLPEILNRVEVSFIDGTPEGYALRILIFYRQRCDERWTTSGLPKEKSLVYDLMNEHQIHRAAELDKAIIILQQTSKQKGG